MTATSRTKPTGEAAGLRARLFRAPVEKETNMHPIEIEEGELMRYPTFWGEHQWKTGVVLRMPGDPQRWFHPYDGSKPIPHSLALWR
jgi:hypothetical protein